MSMLPFSASRVPRLPLFTVLNPRRHTPLLAAVLAGVVLTGWYEAHYRGWKLWQSTALVMAVMLVPLSFKWRADAHRFGVDIAMAGALAVVQTAHTTEHIVQWIQRHILEWPLRQSTGLLSPANTEWVHFVWNWLVFAMIVTLLVRGMRGPWAWVWMIWSLAHTMEHTYMMIRFLQVSHDLRGLGFSKVTAQGLPGVLGRDGWLDRNRDGTFSFVCKLPLVSTATRLDTHAFWNTGEVVFMLLAFNSWFRRVFGSAMNRPVTEAALETSGSGTPGRSSAMSLRTELRSR